jgi:hypothetical protein
VHCFGSNYACRSPENRYSPIGRRPSSPNEFKKAKERRIGRIRGLMSAAKSSGRLNLLGCRPIEATLPATQDGPLLSWACESPPFPRKCRRTTAPVQSRPPRTGRRREKRRPRPSGNVYCDSSFALDSRPGCGDPLECRTDCVREHSVVAFVQEMARPLHRMQSRIAA